MKYLITSAAVAIFLIPACLSAQNVTLDKAKLEPHQVSMEFVQQMEKKAVKVIKDSTVRLVDEPTFVKIKDIDFHDGTIEVKVLSKLLKNAPQLARGFIGIAFRINEDNSCYESIYIRPTNGRANDQVRRNHSIQYYCAIRIINSTVSGKTRRKNMSLTPTWI
ncbi:hypothetical protein [Dyadobacter frigoris]|uniref:hypothetical protein n=1 Tax=Dyadobacter frigoris TaxID=2576211 RepID=UPI001C700AA7|nr:hypothetical protein [Dyadobacter frigoris]GLU55281.1 hypothetical protein Dfri01_47420 [Dyadobacter frigoris]